jgi:hypothetical protein
VAPSAADGRHFPPAMARQGDKWLRRARAIGARPPRGGGRARRVAFAVSAASTLRPASARASSSPPPGLAAPRERRASRRSRSGSRA